MNDDEKKLNKLVDYATDPGLAMYDQLQELEDGVSKLLVNLSDTDFSALETLQGEQGIQGEKGDTGEKGEKGDKGEKGEPGKNGRDGIDGLDGIDGKDGKDGKDGVSGSDTPLEIKAKLFLLSESDKLKLQDFGGFESLVNTIEKLGKSKGNNNLLPYSGITTTFFALNGVDKGRAKNINLKTGSALNVTLSGDTATITIPTGGSGGGVQSVNSGTDITVDNTDPTNPVVNFTGFIPPSGGTTLIGQTSGIVSNPTGNANGDTWLGSGAGSLSASVDHTVFLGENAGRNGTAADKSVFIGGSAGQGASTAAHSIFIGLNAGLNDTVNNTGSDTSIILGVQSSTGGFKNSIALGSFTTNTATNQFLVDDAYSHIVFAGLPGNTGLTSAGFVSVASTGELFIDSTNTGKFLIGETSGIISNPAAILNHKTFLGELAGNGTTLATNGVAVGYKTAQGASDSNTFVAIGNEAGATVASAGITQGVFIGDRSGKGAYAPESIYMGIQAGENATNGFTSTYLGFQVGQGADNGNNSVFIGNQAGSGSIDGYYSVWLGPDAGRGSQQSYQSIFVGNQAGNGSDLSHDSIFMGSAAGTSASGSDQSIFLGYQAGNAASNSNDSIFIGTNSGDNNNPESIAIGKDAGGAGSGGGAPGAIAIGKSAGNGNNQDSVALGNNSVNLQTNEFLMDGAYTHIVFQGLPLNTGAGLTSVGVINVDASGELFTDTTAAGGKDLIGQTEGIVSAPAPITSTHDTWLGYLTGDPGNVAGLSTFIGYAAGQSVAANETTFVGVFAGSTATNTGGSTFLGSNAGNAATDANQSIFLGREAGRSAALASYSIFIGDAAGNGDTVDNSGGSHSILIGDSTNTNGYVNSIALGTSAQNSTANQFLVAPAYTEIDMGGALRLHYSGVDDRYDFSSGAHGIFYNGVGAPNALNSVRGLGMDFRQNTSLEGNESYYFGSSFPSENFIRVQNDLTTSSVLNRNSTSIFGNYFNKGVPVFTGVGSDDLQNITTDYLSYASFTYTVTITDTDNEFVPLITLVGAAPQVGDVVNNLTNPGFSGVVVATDGTTYIRVNTIVGGAFAPGDNIEEAGSTWTATVDNGAYGYDVISWNDGTTFATDIPTHSNIALSYGTNINFSVETGHTNGDQWVFINERTPARKIVADNQSNVTGIGDFDSAYGGSFFKVFKDLSVLRTNSFTVEDQSGGSIYFDVNFPSQYVKLGYNNDFLNLDIASHEFEANVRDGNSLGQFGLLADASQAFLSISDTATNTSSDVNLNLTNATLTLNDNATFTATAENTTTYSGLRFYNPGANTTTYVRAYDTNIVNFLDGELSVQNKFGNKFLDLDQVAGIYDIGDSTNYLHSTYLRINDTLKLVRFWGQSGHSGLSLDFANNIYILGEVSAGNATRIQIEDPSKIISMVGGVAYHFQNKTGTYTVGQDDYTVNATANTFTITLDSATNYYAGQIFVIKNSGAGTITVVPTGGDTIDGGASVTLTPLQSITIQVDNFSGNFIII